MPNLIKCYMKVKNVWAEGEFNLETNSLNVFKGAIFEKNETKAFSKHTYYKLRIQIIKSVIKQIS